MSYGIEIKNQEGNLLIDGNFSNARLIDSGTATSNQTDFGADNLNNREFAQISIPSGFESNCFIGVELPVGRFCYGVNKGSNFFRVFMESGFSFYYEIYALVQDITSSGYGIQVFNSFGDPVFDSNFDYIDIKDFLPVSSPSLYVGPSPPRPFSFTYSSASNNDLIFGMTTNVFVRQQVEPSVFVNLYTYYFRLNTSTILTQNDEDFGNNSNPRENELGGQARTTLLICNPQN